MDRGDLWQQEQVQHLDDEADSLASGDADGDATGAADQYDDQYGGGQYGDAADQYGGYDSSGGGNGDPGQGEGGAYTDAVSFSGVVSGIGGALYHSAGEVYHDAQADIAWAEGDQAGMQRHLAEADQSLHDAAADLQPGFDVPKDHAPHSGH
jgi:hypothetical protein